MFFSSQRWTSTERSSVQEEDTSGKDWQRRVFIRQVWGHLRVWHFLVNPHDSKKHLPCIRFTTPAFKSNISPLKCFFLFVLFLICFLLRQSNISIFIDVVIYVLKVWKDKATTNLSISKNSTKLALALSMKNSKMEWIGKHNPSKNDRLYCVPGVVSLSKRKKKKNQKQSTKNNSHIPRRNSF